MKKCLAAMVFLLWAVAVSAQPQGEREYIENNDFGFSFFTGFVLQEPMEFSMTRNFGINAIYHPVKSLGIEPGIFVSRNEEDETNNTTEYVSSYRSSMFGGSLGIYYYRHLKNNLYLYTGPRGVYVNMDVNSFNSSDSSRSERNGYYAGAYLVFGLKYMFNDNVGIFGDFSMGYLHHEYDNKNYDSSGNLTSDRTRTEKYITASSGIMGISFYF